MSVLLSWGSGPQPPWVLLTRRVVPPKVCHTDLVLLVIPGGCGSLRDSPASPAPRFVCRFRGKAKKSEDGPRVGRPSTISHPRKRLTVPIRGEHSLGSLPTFLRVGKRRGAPIGPLSSVLGRRGGEGLTAGDERERQVDEPVAVRPHLLTLRDGRGGTQGAQGAHWLIRRGVSNGGVSASKKTMQQTESSGKKGSDGHVKIKGNQKVLKGSDEEKLS